jgi:hypothetical protein
MEMNQRIIFQKDDGGITVLIPAPECLLTHTIQEIAEKDVPAGKPYKIVSADDIPSDRTFRNAWEADESTLTDGTGGEHDMFITDPAHPDYVEPTV